MRPEAEDQVASEVIIPARDVKGWSQDFALALLVFFAPFQMGCSYIFITFGLSASAYGKQINIRHIWESKGIHWVTSAVKHGSSAVFIIKIAFNLQAMLFCVLQPLPILQPPEEEQGAVLLKTRRLTLVLPCLVVG